MPRSFNPGIAAAAIALAALIAFSLVDRAEPPVEPRPKSTDISRPAAIAAKQTGPVGRLETVTARNVAPTKPSTLAPHPTPFDEPVSKTPEPDTAPTPKPAAEVSFGDGEAAFNAQDYKAATTLFTRFVERHPDNPWGHYMRGLSLWKDGHPSEAENAFRIALVIDPDHVKSLVNLGRVLIELDHTDDALEMLVIASDLDPDSSTIHRLIGRAYHSQGKVDEAVDAYQRAIVLDGQDAWAMNNLGLLLFEQGRPADALFPLARAVELRSDVSSFNNNLGMALEHAGLFAAAAEAYDAALEIDPDADKPLANLMRVQKVVADPTKPFDLDATAARFVADTKTWRDRQYASR
jgi:tetratricopeptide (TPR) repeat protein